MQILIGNKKLRQEIEILQAQLERAEDENDELRAQQYEDGETIAEINRRLLDLSDKLEAACKS